MEKLYLVPHDFTEVADKAVLHAMRMAHQTKGKVLALHIVKREDQVGDMERQLKSRLSKLDNMDIAGWDAAAKAGSIFTDIGRVAERTGARLIVMGTHGAKGMQKVFGSFAMKVISSTSVPFMIVQEGGELREINKIVFPITTELQSLQILETVSRIAKMFRATIQLVARKESDATLAHKVKNRMKVVAKELKEAEVEYEGHYVTGSGGLAKLIVDFAEKHEADVLAATHDMEKLLSQLDRHAQAMITNRLNRPTLIIRTTAVTNNAYF